AVVRQELGQRFLRFVHVVVGVKHRKRQLAGRHGDLLAVVLIGHDAGLVMTLPPRLARRNRTPNFQRDSPLSRSITAKLTVAVAASSSSTLRKMSTCATRDRRPARRIRGTARAKPSRTGRR